MVSRWSSSSYFDETVNAADGTPSAPFILELTEPNTIHFCENQLMCSFTQTTASLIGLEISPVGGCPPHCPCRQFGRQLDLCA